MMGGRVNLSSAVGRGTRVEVELGLQILEPVNFTPITALPLIQQPRYRLQVLIVDDHEVNRQVLRQQLNFLGHDVSEAENGRSAFERWCEHAFDIVITDCHMPVMSGAELTQAIRQVEEAQGLEASIILGLTADAQSEEIELCLKVGMNDCLIKPIALDELDARLLQCSKNESPAIDLQSTERLEARPVSTSVVDLGPLEMLISSEPEKFRQILDELINNNRKDCKALGIFMQEDQFEKLAELAHRIKGAARVVKAEQLVECCRQLEVLCRTPEMYQSQISDVVVEVQAAITALEQALMSYR